MQSAGGLGRRALGLGLQTLDIARMHEHALATLSAISNSGELLNGMVKRAGDFFAETIIPIEKTHRAAIEINLSLKEQITALRQRTLELATTSRQLKTEVFQRKVAEQSLVKSKHRYELLLEQSHQMQEQLRHLSHQILIAQEDERKEISRELHDEIAQTLAGINIHLASLNLEAAINAKGLSKKITNTQRLVERSVKIVHRFARELRPTVLDDLGLIPALHSYMKDFTKRTGIHIKLTAFSGVERLTNTKRTVIFRVTQAALINVSQHAQATNVNVSIKKLLSTVCLQIHDDGKSFKVESVLSSRRIKYLGLISMRERVKMVGGSFSIESSPGKGTTIQACMPFSITTRK